MSRSEITLRDLRELPTKISKTDFASKRGKLSYCLMQSTLPLAGYEIIKEYMSRYSGEF